MGLRRLAIQNLSEAIDAQKSQAVVKNNNITLRLVKKKESTKWKDLIQKEGDVSKPETPQQPDKSADPSASLMDMMKKMYEEGDDNMKKTIAEAWTKSREKGGAPDML